MSNPLLYPSIGGAPGTSIQSKDPVQAPDRGITEGGSSQVTHESFNQLLGNELSKNVTEPLKFSAHASARAQSRKLDLGPDQMRKLNEAVQKAAAKGLDDALILTSDAAFIVSVKNKTVVTALDRKSMDGNVFTNIDGAVVI
jgi:flagellar operon protein